MLPLRKFANSLDTQADRCCRVAGQRCFVQRRNDLFAANVLSVGIDVCQCRQRGMTFEAESVHGENTTPVWEVRTLKRSGLSVFLEVCYARLRDWCATGSSSSLMTIDKRNETTLTTIEPQNAGQTPST